MDGFTCEKLCGRPKIKTTIPKLRRYKVKISKRQLKRIIREEYSRLKRRGLLKENNSHLQKLVMLLLDDSVKEKDVAIDLGMGLGVFEVEQYMESQSGGYYAMASEGTKKEWKLQCTPEFFEIVLEEIDRINPGSRTMIHKKSSRTHDVPDVAVYATERPDFYGNQIIVSVIDRDMEYPHEASKKIINRY